MKCAAVNFGDLTDSVGQLKCFLIIFFTKNISHNFCKNMEEDLVSKLN